MINASTLLIAFHSPGLLSLLSPPHAAAHSTLPATTPNPVGQSAFNFLSNYAPGASLPSGFKTRVKTALKDGRAISLDAQLCTARYRGFEKFVVHWTPLKGERINNREEVGWVVVTLGGGT